MAKSDLIEQLKDYINKTPKDVLQAEWEEYSKKYNHIGPTVDEYLNFINDYRQTQYPKTYQKCCEILNYKLIENNVTGYNARLIGAFQRLKVCRDVYWKIAGKEMGLNKPWEPDLQNKKEDRYAITNVGNNIAFERYGGEYNGILLFPTEEIRNIFYENFTDLIEQCKELL